MKKFIYFAAAALVFASAASCEQNGGETDITNPYDEQFAKIADRFVNETVIPTYEALSTSTAELEGDSAAAAQGRQVPGHLGGHLREIP